MSEIQNPNQGQQMPTAVDTAGGVIVGTDPTAPPVQQQSLEQPLNSGQPGQTPGLQQPQQPAQQTPQGLFTEEQMAQARREEKDKLYPELETMKNEMAAIRQEREAELAEKQRLEEEAVQARREKEESELDTRALLEKREQEWAERFEGLNNTLQERDAILAKEQELRELEGYKSEVLAQHSEAIFPELRNSVGGNSYEEIDASIQRAIEQTASIMENVAQAQQPAVPFSQPRGASPTAPPVGPMEQQTQYETITPQDIASMDMETYKRHRDTLVPAAGRAYRNQG